MGQGAPRRTAAMMATMAVRETPLMPPSHCPQILRKIAGEVALEEGVKVPESRLEVRVEGSVGAIPARAFLDVLRTSLQMLDELDRALQSPPSQWLIEDLRSGSAVAVLRREGVASGETPQRLVDGIRQLREAEELPRFFSPTLAGHLVKIGKYFLQEGISRISYRVPNAALSDQPEPVTGSVVANARASIEAVEQTVGSAVGVLDIINLRRGRHVSLYDEETRRAVNCRFPKEHLDEIRDALGHRVRALGTVTRNRRGQILSVDVDQLERLADESDGPSVADLVGIAPWYTGSMSTDEYIRWVRNE